MDVLGRQLMQPELLAQFITEFNKEWERLAGELKMQAATRQRERTSIDRKIANLVDAISEGRSSAAIFAKLHELEAARGQVGDVEPEPGPPCGKFGPELAERYAATIRKLTTVLIEGDDPEGIQSARSLIDQVVIHPKPDGGGPGGIEFIGNLLELLKAAGLGEPSGGGKAALATPVLELYVSSVKEGPGAKPLAFLGARGYCGTENTVPTPGVPPWLVVP
jgi:hypothetical protein